MSPRPLAGEAWGALLELEPSEPYIGRRGCPIDHKVAQRLNRGAGERAGSGPASQLNFGWAAKTGAAGPGNSLSRPKTLPESC